MRKPAFYICENRLRSAAVTAQLIRAFIFPSGIMQSKIPSCSLCNDTGWIVSDPEVIKLFSSPEPKAHR